MSKYTQKSCLGCSAVVEMKPGSVCGSCSIAIRHSPEARARFESSASAALKEFLMGERAGIPSAIYSYKSKNELASSIGALLRCVGHAIQNTMLHNSHNPRKIQYSHYGILEVEHRDINSQDWQLFLPQDVEAHLSMLYQAIAQVVKEAENMGQSKGQNLLMQLNAGTLSLASFEASKEACEK